MPACYKKCLKDFDFLKVLKIYMISDGFFFFLTCLDSLDPLNLFGHQAPLTLPYIDVFSSFLGISPYLGSPPGGFSPCRWHGPCQKVIPALLDVTQLGSERWTLQKRQGEKKKSFYLVSFFLFFFFSKLTGA